MNVTFAVVNVYKRPSSISIIKSALSATKEFINYFRFQFRGIQGQVSKQDQPELMGITPLQADYWLVE